MRTPARKCAAKATPEKWKKPSPSAATSPLTSNTRGSKRSACMEPPSARSRTLFPDDELQTSAKSRGKNKMEEYPLLTKFCYTTTELHEEYGLSMEGVLPKDLNDEDLPDEQWLTVFKDTYRKNAKIYLNNVQPRLVDECRLLFHKVYQAPPSCGEITAKFARCFAFENCQAATKNPAHHKVAWARFGESVINMCGTRLGGLERKVEN